MADTFLEQLEEDRDNAFLSEEEHAEEFTHRAVSSGTENPIVGVFEELAGGLEAFADQSVLSRAAVARVSADVTVVVGDELIRDGLTWKVVKIRTEVGMHELRCFTPEVTA